MSLDPGSVLGLSCLLLGIVEAAYAIGYADGKTLAEGFVPLPGHGELEI